MEITYSLTEDDFVAFQMYASGESKQQRKRRLRGRFLVPVIWGLIALYFVSDSDVVVGSVFLLGAVVWLLGYPAYAKWLYRRHFRNHLKENNRGQMNQEVTLRLETEGVFSSGVDSEGTLKYSGFDQLIELETLYLIRLKQGMTLLLPKERLASEELSSFMDAVSMRTELEIQDHRGRPWR
ncbi:YcxB family protein [Coraliomargarita parva]|uniref:YcxB family protein n=1 Tax=Coraliomargarita parva TaxID=3014050 RepID=UPI0022B59296|nr:YcxB family protein [Coraliomargarita parva]